MKERFLAVLQHYEREKGSVRALNMQERFENAKKKIIEENEGVLTWLPERKKDVTLETLLQRTYSKLIEEMESEIKTG